MLPTHGVAPHHKTVHLNPSLGEGDRRRCNSTVPPRGQLAPQARCYVPRTRKYRRRSRPTRGLLGRGRSGIWGARRGSGMAGAPAAAWWRALVIRCPAVQSALAYLSCVCPASKAHLARCEPPRAGRERRKFDLDVEARLRIERCRGRRGLGAIPVQTRDKYRSSADLREDELTPRRSSWSGQSRCMRTQRPAKRGQS